ncbi:YrrS family protein [Virgibacillus siamensis]|uniref:YrrS family protein n=1 Tax=Virgibacillus siamensis TaxID=480071 RepID=UPI00158C3F07|nr:YrrS family protein [Virgibacillus siamensis]
MKSRHSMRKKQRNKNIVINSLIAIVFALILIIGGNLLFNGSKTADEGDSNSKDNNIETNDDKDENADQKQETGNKDPDQQAKEQKSKQNEDEPNKQGSSDDNKTEQDKQNTDKKEKNAKKDKNKTEQGETGKPIGTSQSGPHTSSYDKGTVDWNEKVKAIQTATGLDDGMTIWRMENGGGPQKSIGKVSPNGVSDWMYIVQLQWVNQKGWKVTSVNKQSR